MEENIATTFHGTDALSFDKLISISKVLKQSVKYGKYCCIVNVNTDEDRDIFKYPVRINAHILVICSEGLIELTYNLYRITLSANDMFLYHPRTILQINALKPSNLSIMVFTREFLDDLNLKFDNIPLQHRIVREQQTFSLTEQSCNELRSMLKLTEYFIGMDSCNPYYNEMVKASFKSFIYRALYEINLLYEGTSHSAEPIPPQENSHFDRFMRLLQENYTRHHSIRFYADKMGLSPKYLSLVIKNASGRLATEWIDEYVILEAKNLIKYSSMSIQEISYTLNFPNQSFFGKYFKRHTGLSPKTYRTKP